ncbi:mercury resistance system periplasmic binding protein MerP [Permianibacter sp. IMCC34836]|uniref:mercury resistance system periplasmic binding protein MerP n=1 Tax=Permianibacter fluminis TaxID=2738515 RepID=UPI001554EED2|nr:mercury resistance system periplasmic binding protein MerP [Permianibacter fluminis]NQD37979.1 mercury resistance system periplasmic binding protein MerP [Permianibacter fluminis]
MKRWLIAIMALSSAAAVTNPVYAASQTVTLSVPSMTCVTCPITVKKALNKVDGVLTATVSWEPKEAVVKYDDSKTTIEALIKATADVGYPSTLKAPQQ